MMSWQEAFTLAINTRGYIVMGSHKPWPIGATVDYLDTHNGRANHPFKVVSETDVADATAQTDLWELDRAYQKPYRYYYRLTTD